MKLCVCQLVDIHKAGNKLDAAPERRGWPEFLLVSLLFAKRAAAIFLVPRRMRCVDYHCLLLINFSQSSRPEHIQNTP